MANILASTIVNKASVLLQDATNVRWTQAELLGWLNDGQREVVFLKPDAYATNETMKLATGTKQALPVAGLQLLSVVRNMGATGLTPGKAVRLVDRDILDVQLPDWHAAEASAEALHYVYDDRNPKNFYVYPPQPATGQGYVELVYSTAPADVALSDSIKLDDIYANALLDYIMYRAYSKDADYAANAGRASALYQAFMTSIGARGKVEVPVDPNAVSNTGPFASLRRSGGGQ